MSDYVPLRVKVRRWLRKLLPQRLFGLVQGVWIKSGARLFKVQDVVDKYTTQFLAQNPKVVQGGPFAGMVYVDEAVGSNYIHKLIGSYEAVLHTWFQSIKERNFDNIIDIGCAEGFYLIGLGRWFSNARLVGFEPEAKGRQLARLMYTKNDLTNELVLNREATSQNIAPYMTKNTLLICDCEGAEFDILNPEVSPSLLDVDTMVVELHDFIKPGIKEELVNRFSETHQISILPFKMVEPEKFTFLASITNQKELFELRRERGWQEQEWMIIEKKPNN